MMASNSFDPYSAFLGSRISSNQYVRYMENIHRQQLIAAGIATGGPFGCEEEPKPDERLLLLEDEQ